MNCPHCDAPPEEEGASFCGECGGAMTAPVAAAVGDAVAATTSPVIPVPAAAANSLLRCNGCGAGPNAIDEDGFCTGCGAQRKKPARDHFEVIISPRCAGVSDIGKTHKQNEDYISLAAVVASAPGKESAHVLVLCDGVSQSQNPQLGSKAGCEAACASVVAQLAEAAQNPTSDTVDSQAIVRRAIVAAQEAICKVPFQPGLKGKGFRELDPAQSTIVLALVQDRKIHIGWAGDSRGYWVSKSVQPTVAQITRDDSWADEQVAAGRMTLVEAMKRPEAHAITNSLGALPNGRNPGITPTVLTMNVAESGRLILCSDGFWNYAEDPRTIAKLVAAQPANVDALTLARALVDYARGTTNGGKDNISVIVRDF